MAPGDPIKARLLPDGAAYAVILRSSLGRVLEIEARDSAEQCAPGSAMELEDREAIYLGIVGRREDGRLWVNVEHRLDLAPLNALRAVWREGG